MSDFGKRTIEVVEEVNIALRALTAQNHAPMPDRERVPAALRELGKILGAIATTQAMAYDQAHPPKPETQVELVARFGRALWMDVVDETSSSRRAWVARLHLPGQSQSAVSGPRSLYMEALFADRSSAIEHARAYARALGLTERAGAVGVPMWSMS